MHNKIKNLQIGLNILLGFSLGFWACAATANMTLSQVFAPNSANAIKQEIVFTSNNAQGQYVCIQAMNYELYDTADCTGGMIGPQEGTACLDANGFHSGEDSCTSTTYLNLGQLNFTKNLFAASIYNAAQVTGGAAFRIRCVKIKLPTSTGTSSNNNCTNISTITTILNTDLLVTNCSSENTCSLDSAGSFTIN